MITDVEARHAAMTIIRYCVEHTCDTCALSHACYKLRGEEMPCLCIEEETMKNMTAGEEELLLYAKRIKMYCDYMLNDTDGGCQNCIFNTPHKCALMAGEPSAERCPAGWLV